eukprot:GHVN01011530.1.p1 GENE.GHVN01011530.1~~GHVN01011530.1.p1  ORF type:complete len:161 (+),score=5.04 GHVN01011530.1:448-930(+)
MPASSRALLHLGHIAARWRSVSGVSSSQKRNLETISSFYTHILASIGLIHKLPQPSCRTHFHPTRPVAAALTIREESAVFLQPQIGGAPKPDGFVPVVGMPCSAAPPTHLFPEGHPRLLLSSLFLPEAHPILHQCILCRVGPSPLFSSSGASFLLLLCGR